MEKIGILYHPYKSESQHLAGEIAAWLAERGIVGLVAPDRDGYTEENVVVRNMAGLSLLIVLGGDGSTLRAAKFASAGDVPIFGVNLGRVGFMSEAEPDDWPEQLGKVIAGNWWPEERLMLHGALQRKGQPVIEMAALNDVVISRGGQARIVQLRLYVDGDYVTSYTADGLIIATPTGSTAYAMAAGGPLLWPRLPNFLVIPVAPHLSLDRAVVLHQTAVVSIEIETELEAALTIDGQGAFPILAGDQVVVRQNAKSCTFARVGSGSYFYHRLMERFGYWHPNTR